MNNALIGYTGFVGGNLALSRPYQSHYRSNDIDLIRGECFEHVVCAGVQAMKWWANLHPDEDLAKIETLLDALSELKADRFTLISTIDVYPSPQGVDENTIITSNGHHPYGMNRLFVEKWVRSHFPRSLIVRLPGLFGPGIKKNVIFDMLHCNDLEKINPNGTFQYYDLRRLDGDIENAWKRGISLLNISSEPISTFEIQERFFGKRILGDTGPPPASYDMRSCHTGHWNGSDGYLYSKIRVLADLGDWLQSEQDSNNSQLFQ